MSWATLAAGVLRTTVQTFKSSATYTPIGTGVGVPIDGVFDKEHQMVDPQTGAPIDSIRPTFGIVLADLDVAPDAGDTLTIGAITYRVYSVEEDGQGGAKLILGGRS